MKHAFMVMCHTNFDQVSRLLKYLDRIADAIVIGIDRRSDMPGIKEKLCDCIKKAKVNYVPLKLYWGGYSLISGTLSMLESLENEDYDYVHFITGQDVPLMDTNHFHSFLEKHNGCNFVEFNPKNYNFAHWKCDYHHLLVENPWYRTSLPLKILSHGIVKIEKILHIKQSYKDLYHGSAYFSITEELAHELVKNKNKFSKLYKKAIAADEVWLQTFVMASKYKASLYDFEKPDGNLRYIDWKRRKGNSPYTFTDDDYEELKSVVNTTYLFGRKFDMRSNPNIIDKVYALIE